MANTNSKSDYVGKIKRGGNMEVKAPINAETKKGKSKKNTGKDLRSGK